MAVLTPKPPGKQRRKASSAQTTDTSVPPEVAPELSFADLVPGVARLPKAELSLAAIGAPPVESSAAVPQRATSRSLLVEEVGGLVRGRADGVSVELLLALASGSTPPQRELDLHRLSVESAQQRLRQGLSQARREGVATVLIIHGRGAHSGVAGPVLPEVVREELVGPCSAHVLAFCTAPSRFGGRGAVLVRLSVKHASDSRR